MTQADEIDRKSWPVVLSAVPPRGTAVQMTECFPLPGDTFRLLSLEDSNTKLRACHDHHDSGRHRGASGSLAPGEIYSGRQGEETDVFRTQPTRFQRQWERFEEHSRHARESQRISIHEE